MLPRRLGSLFEGCGRVEGENGFGRERGISNGRGDGVEITDWRTKIDGLDEEIVGLINRRAEAARAIGELKRQAGMPVYEPRREDEVFAHVKAKNAGPLADAEIQHVFERIIDVMRTLQQRP